MAIRNCLFWLSLANFCELSLSVIIYLITAKLMQQTFYNNVITSFYAPLLYHLQPNIFITLEIKETMYHRN